MINFKNIMLEKVVTQEKGKIRYLLNGEQLFPEQIAIKHYEKKGLKSLWTENDYWWTIMGLLFWDVIFTKVYGAFQITIDGEQLDSTELPKEYKYMFEELKKTNGMPNDFFSSMFYQRRENIINNKIKELLNSNISEKLKESYTKNFNKNCRPINNWEKFTLEQLSLATDQLEKNKLLKIMERLLFDFKENRRGLPDLTIFNDNEICFVEVKSENDKISEDQKEWLEFLSKSLELKVELFLINHTEKLLNNIKKIFVPSSKEITITFGISSSKKLQDAIDFAKSQKTFFSEGSGKDIIYGAKFDINDIENLYKMLDFTSGWKNQKIEVDDTIIKSTELRESLWCFRKKNELKATKDYCLKYENNEPNIFGCRQVYLRELESDYWKNYGYIDTTKGIWVFNKSEINKAIEDRITKTRFCPLLNPKKIKSLVKNLPDTIDPKINKNWSMISNDDDEWIWQKDHWDCYLDYDNGKKFPGFEMMIGVSKIDEKKIRSYLEFKTEMSLTNNKNDRELDDELFKKMGVKKKSIFQEIKKFFKS